jgi:hypothetical protein
MKALHERPFPGLIMLGAAMVMFMVMMMTVMLVGLEANEVGRSTDKGKDAVFAVAGCSIVRARSRHCAVRMNQGKTEKFTECIGHFQGLVVKTSMARAMNFAT